MCKSIGRGVFDFTVGTICMGFVCYVVGAVAYNIGRFKGKHEAEGKTQ